MTRRALTDFETIRAQDLLVLRASEGLIDEQERELEALGGSEIDSFDLAAAMIDVAMYTGETMPDHVADAVLAAAPSASRKPATPFTAPALPAIAASMTVRAVSAPPVRPAPRRGSRIAIVGMLAAAMVGGLVIGRLSSSSTPSASSTDHARAAGGGDDPAGDDRVAQWTGTGVTGSIRWSRARQRGSFEIRGLPVNDPRQARFQLWIVDRDRDARYPVDGGLFDVVGADTSLAVQPRIRVTTPSEFLITREAPGGAVVSDRKDLVARAVVP